MRAIGLPYPDGIAGTGGDLFAVRSVINYHASAHYDEVLEIVVRAEKLGNSSMTFEMGIFRDGERLISGEMVYVNADPDTRKSDPCRKNCAWPSRPTRPAAWQTDLPRPRSRRWRRPEGSAEGGNGGKATGTDIDDAGSMRSERPLPEWPCRCDGGGR